MFKAQVKLAIPLILLFFATPSLAVRFCTRVSAALGNEDLAVPEISALGRLGGAENLGFFEYVDREGRRHLVKVLDIAAGHSETAGELAAALAGTALLESLGGPKLYAHGVVETEGPPAGKYYYLDMEKLEDGIALKSGRAEKILELLATPAARAALPISVANHFIGSLEKNISAVDPDFWILPTGDVRWIDGGQWTRITAEKAAYQYAAATTWFLLRRMATLEDALVDEPLGRAFLDTTFQQLTRSRAIAWSARTTFLNYFSNLGAMADFGAVDPAWARRYLRRHGILPEERIDYQEESQRLRAYCAGQ